MDTIGLDSEAKEEEQLYQNSLEILSEIAGRSYEPGEKVFSEGDPGMEIHFIISGAVKIYLGHDDKRRELMTLTAGDIFGEMALLDQKPRSASVEAYGPTRSLVLDRRLFYHLIGEYPILAKKVIELMGRRMRSMDSQFKQESGYSNLE